jgi:hypothetical protein
MDSARNATGSQEIPVDIAAGYGVRFPTRQETFLYSTGSGTHPGSSQIETGTLSQGVQRPGDMKLTTHVHLVSRSRMVEMFIIIITLLE